MSDRAATLIILAAIALTWLVWFGFESLRGHSRVESAVDATAFTALFLGFRYWYARRRLRS